MINSDRLGAKGENRFQEFCEDSGLTCNKSFRDRTGWDFLVEFDFEDEVLSSLDHRKTPIASHVQVKTILSRTRDVTLALNMAERLAKELKPAFVYVLKVNDNLEFEECYLLHIIDDHLGKILKRLRKESANGNREKINKKEISFTPNQDERVELGGAALRNALQSRCGTDLFKYAEKKQNQLKILGYDALPYEGVLSVAKADFDAFEEVLLGLRDKVSISDFNVFETRFGIKLPQVQSSAAILSIQSAPRDECSLTIRGDAGYPPAVFAAKLYVLPPSFKSTKKRMHLKSDYFSLVIDVKKQGSKLDFTFHAENDNRPLKSWGHLWRMLHTFYEKRGSMLIRSKNFHRDIEIEISEQEISTSFGNIKPWIELSEKMEVCLTHAGEITELSITRKEIYEARIDVSMLYELITNRNSDATLSGRLPKTPSGLKRQKIIFTRCFRLGDAFISYYAMAQFEPKQEGKEFIWKLSNFSLRKVRVIQNSEGSYDFFIADAQQTESWQDVFRLDTDFSTEAQSQPEFTGEILIPGSPPVLPV